MTYAVLVVDDEPPVLRLVRIILEDAGFNVLTAGTGQEALGLLCAHHIDAVLTDLKMPGMSGIDLMREAYRHRPDLAICCMTGHWEDFQLLPKAVPVILKPFNPEALVETVQEALRERSTSLDPGPEGTP